MSDRGRDINSVIYNVAGSVGSLLLMGSGVDLTEASYEGHIERVKPTRKTTFVLTSIWMFATSTGTVSLTYDPTGSAPGNPMLFHGTATTAMMPFCPNYGIPYNLSNRLATLILTQNNNGGQACIVTGYWH